MCTSSSLQRVPILYNGPPLFLLGTWTPWLLGPTWIHNPNSTLNSPTVYAGLTNVTDRPRYSVCNNRPLLCMRCGEIIITSVKVVWHKATSPPHMDGSVKFARWHQRPPHTKKALEPRNRLHRIAWPRKPTPRIKQRVASYHTTEVIAHRKAKSGCHGNVPWVQGIGNICILSADRSNPPS